MPLKTSKSMCKKDGAYEKPTKTMRMRVITHDPNQRAFEVK